MIARWSLLLTVLGAAALAAPPPVVPLSPGETLLSDIGIYRVAYQLDGQPEREMPVSWTGLFEPGIGIAYVPGDQCLGRPAMLLHCPWMNGTGTATVDYRLALPAVKPIALSFSIAMRPDIAVPDKSDGVTFACYLVVDGQPRQLMRQHWAKGEWQDCRFDLSEYAGREVTVRLQTDPGPARNPSFDFSYFGGAKVTVGEASSRSKAQIADELMATKALRATDGVGLERVQKTGRMSVVPANLLNYRNRYRQVGDAHELSYEADDCGLVYTYRPQTGRLDDWTVSIDGGPPLRPAQGGGLTLAVERQGKTVTEPAVGSKQPQVAFDYEAGVLVARWEYQDGQQATWKFGLEGKALTVQVSSPQAQWTGLSLGHVGGAPLRRLIGVPYLLGSMEYLPANRAYACRFLDWTRSRASYAPQGDAHYQAKTDGRRNSLSETGYVAVSPHVAEVLPDIPHQPSPFMKVLGPRVMFDIWGHRLGTYASDAEWLRELKDNGIDHVVIIQHDWQRFGYDVKLPDHIPANPHYGGDPGLIEFGRAANEAGYVWSVHENYIDLYPDAPSYDPGARVLRGDGTPSPAWYNPGTKVQSFGLKCNRALGYAKQNSPQIHQRYGTTAGYLDVHTCVPPWHQLDLDATQPLAGMFAAKVKHDTELFQYMRDTHGGPLFGEGANHFYWAGKADGVEAQVAGGEHHAPLLEFDLLRIHPRMTNHGMGYYARWYARGYDLSWGSDAGAPEQIDKYRAMELAYGHAGWIETPHIWNTQWVAKEHHLMHPVQRLYGGGAKVTDIRYEIDGRFVPAAVALAVGDTWRQRVRYDSGLTLYVNWAKQPWTVAGRTLPQWGFVAQGPDTIATTYQQDGRFGDFVDCPEYVFADARTSFDMPYAKGATDVEPRLKSFRHLGGNEIEVTYEWLVGETLPEDYHCFVHFVNEQGEGSDHIVGQQDHALPKPTTQWRPGERIVDGPYRIKLTDDPKYATQDLVIGLYKGARAALKGLDVGGSRILLARLVLERRDGQITGITLGDLTRDREQRQVKPADFGAHLNPAGTLLDFGPVATDGSVKINREPRRLVIFPYPRGKAFTVKLDVAKLAKGAPATGLKVRALAARTQADLGEVPATVEGGRLVFRTTVKAAGRYVIGW